MALTSPPCLSQVMVFEPTVAVPSAVARQVGDVRDLTTQVNAAYLAGLRQVGRGSGWWGWGGGSPGLVSGS